MGVEEREKNEFLPTIGLERVVCGGGGVSLPKLHPISLLPVDCRFLECPHWLISAPETERNQRRLPVLILNLVINLFTWS